VTWQAQGQQLHVEFIRVPYDIERAAQAIEASAVPHEYAEMLRAKSSNVLRPVESVER
jgi:hypothetical protein